MQRRLSTCTSEPSAFLHITRYVGSSYPFGCRRNVGALAPLLSHIEVRLIHSFSAAPLVCIIVHPSSSITIITPLRCLAFRGPLEVDLVRGFGGPAL